MKRINLAELLFYYFESRDASSMDWYVIRDIERALSENGTLYLELDDDAICYAVQDWAVLFEFDYACGNKCGFKRSAKYREYAPKCWIGVGTDTKQKIEQCLKSLNL